MASSIHLIGQSLPVTRCDEMSVIVRINQKPTSTNNVVYFAMQMTWHQVNDSERGGGHCGLQVGNAFTTTGKTGSNFGGYDDVAGGTYRGSISALGYGNSPNSPNFDWAVDTEYLLRVFKSPKQNWTAAELNTGGDQAAGEIAWRFTITDLITQITTTVRDILVPNCATTGAMSTPWLWVEDFNTATAPTATVAWEVRWSELRMDGRLVPTTKISYPANADSLTNTNSNIDKRGWYQKSVTTRTTAHDDLLNHPGPVVRMTAKESMGNKTASSSMSITLPAAPPVNDRLYAVIATDWGHTPSAPSGWRQLGQVGGSTNHAKVTVFTATVATTPITEASQVTAATSYTFTNSASTQVWAGVLLSLYGADAIAPGRMGAGTEGTTSTWNAPLVGTTTNYGRVFIVASVRPGGSGTSTTFTGSVPRLKFQDTIDITGDWITLALAEEVTPQPAFDAVAKSGSHATGSGVGVQFIAFPALQRLRPISDTAVGAGATTVPASDPVVAYNVIDDTVPDASDKLVLPNAANTSVKLTSAGLTNPNTSQGFRIRTLYRRQNAASGSFVLDLFEGAPPGGTVRATKTVTVTSGDAWLNDEFLLTTTEAASITDRTNLYLRISPTLA